MLSLSHPCNTGKVCVSVCGWGGGGGITFHPVGTRRWTGACFLAHLLIYLPITTTPFTSYTHKHTHALRLQEFRAGDTRTPLNSTSRLFSNEYLTSVAQLITDPNLCALLTLCTHRLTHTRMRKKRLRVKKHWLNFPKQPGQPCPNVLNIILKLSFDWAKWPRSWICLQH